jgi:hypothetical protein
LSRRKRNHQRRRRSETWITRMPSIIRRNTSRNKDLESYHRRYPNHQLNTIHLVLIWLSRWAVVLRTCF